MDFIERVAASLMFRLNLQEKYYGNAFQEFFNELMSYCDPEFLAVRTAGQLGDLSADGLTLISGRLYACYAPEVYEPKNIHKKFDDDLCGALAKRNGEFGTFVFVHNGLRGLHPQVTQKMAQARLKHPGFTFESMGPIHLRRRLLKLDRAEVEDLLGSQIPVEALQFRVGIEDLTPLLEHLEQLSKVKVLSSLAHIPTVSGLKMEFNRMDDQAQAELREHLRSTYLVEGYYDGRREIPERDLVAEDLKAEYLELKQQYSDPDDIIWQLEQYIAGNASLSPRRRRAVGIILAHFFETCDIFDEPTREWLEKRSA